MNVLKAFIIPCNDILNDILTIISYGWLEVAFPKSPNKWNHPKFTKRGSDKIELVFQKSFANSLNNKLFKINPLLQFNLRP